MLLLGNMTRFAFLCDLHYGFERRGGHKVPLHDLTAFGAAFAFLEDFKPHILILGGDWLDCGVVSHHNSGKPGRTEGLRLLADAQACRADTLTPLERLPAQHRIYIPGNHEAWLEDLTDDQPGLEGLVSLPNLLTLSHNQWTILPHAGKYHLGKLTFVHGDQLKGGQAVAKNAVIEAERSIRFGHFHTYMAYTKTSFIEEKLGRTGIAVPCLCTKDPKYGEGRGNSWVQGLNYGWLNDNGTYHDYIAIITNGQTIINGRRYRG